MELNWKQEIAKLVYIKQSLAALDEKHLYPHHLPKVRALPAQLEECQARLGFELTQDHIEFLSCANGWNGFVQAADLFGTDDFCDGPRFAAASEILDIYEEGVLTSAAVYRDWIFPIAASSLDGDIFVQVKPGVAGQGKILWFAGYLIDQYDSFSDFFLAMMDYNRLGIERLKGRN